MKKLIISICFLVVSGFISNTFGQSQQEIITSLFKDRGELYFKFNISDTKELAVLSNMISIDEINADEIYAYANKNEFSDFLELDFDYTALTPPSILIIPEMKNSVNLKEIEDWDFYPTYEAYIDMMYQFQTDYPGLCEVISIGQSIEGRELLFVRISDNIGQEEGEAQFLYTGTMHGDETTGFVLLLRLIDYLLSNYGTDPKVTNMVDNLDIWINPAANPDGTYAGGNGSVYGATRYNANGVDLNRNYPDPEDGPHPDGNPWQTETIHFMSFAENNHIVMGANTHGGTEVCNYPWDTWPELHADDDWWQYVCHEYADTAQAYSPGGYMSGYDDGITNGYAWYSISGGRQDYMNYFHQCREFTLEMSDVKLLPANQLPDLWDYNYRSLLNFMEQTLFGVAGTVTDANTGDPVYAEIYIEGYDADSSWVYTDDVFGNYSRPLFEGTYDITYSAFGYYPQTIENVNILNKELTIVDVQLVSGNLIVDFSASSTNISIGSSIDFIDMSFGNIISWEWTFEGGTPSGSTQQNPTGIQYPDEGSFDVSLTVSDGANTQTITKEDYITVSVEFIMQNTTVITCTGVFYDTGGSSGNYSDNENFTMTFLPEDINNKIEIEFTEFNIEYHANCDYDWLKIYDGTNTSSTLIGKYCGTNSPGTITATNEDGALTFEFHSDYSVTELGWSANVSCIETALPPIADFMADVTSIIEGESVQFADMSTNDPTGWEWTFEGGTPAISGIQNPVVTYEIEGVYDVTLIVTNEAGSNTMVKEDYITVDHVTAITELDENMIRLFPNPASHTLNIITNKNTHHISLLNILGSLVLAQSVNSSSFSIDISNLDAGIYFVKLFFGSETVVKKIQVRD